MQVYMRAVDRQWDAVAQVEGDLEEAERTLTTRKLRLDSVSANDLKGQQIAVAALRVAQPVYVSAEVTKLLFTALDGFPDEPMRKEDLPIPNGFAYFEGLGALIGATHESRADIGDYSRELNAVCWAPAKMTDQQDVPVVMLGGYGRFSSPIHACEAEGMHLITIGHSRIGKTIRESIEISRAYDAGIPTPGLGMFDSRASGMDESLLYMASSLWAFMQQKLCVQSVGYLDRSTRKRFVRAGAATVPTIRVIELRKREYQPATPGVGRQVDWSCSWIVSPHWHRYRLADGSYRRKMLAPYPKGPADKPLRGAARLYAVVR